MAINNAIWDGQTQSWLMVIRGKHEPKCNEKCHGDSHWLAGK